ncbi:hypothetical protein PtrSN002B_006616 [Pyrenophora tritici-repentis]|nr:hypothetical protein Alg215_10698 [Pyrenophora tritici-repentis]KAI1547973.1 hypothetical protein PtrSN002B_006616 [Pyrenophora tritici-repentis]KAI1568347.1 hypothetical protein PtrEW4_006485 [Pyrenophora tritici-repentis]KAI1575505.1 hypothetical protein PtrEW7m1_006507 [Pyrenophora tritici-repentis]KAI1601164.1 hypothetical protein PtrCC142_006183 [Pyrenophora tritici-repentis]
MSDTPQIMQEAVKSTVFQALGLYIWQVPIKLYIYFAPKTPTLEDLLTDPRVPYSTHNLFSTEISRDEFFTLLKHHPVANAKDCAFYLSRKLSDILLPWNEYPDERQSFHRTMFFARMMEILQHLAAAENGMFPAIDLCIVVKIPWLHGSEFLHGEELQNANQQLDFFLEQNLESFSRTMRSYQYSFVSSGCQNEDRVLFNDCWVDEYWRVDVPVWRPVTYRLYKFVQTYGNWLNYDGLGKWSTLKNDEADWIPSRGYLGVHIAGN